MIDRGEAYMIMEKTVAALPQKSFRTCPWSAKRETNTTAEKTVSTKVRIAKILLFSFLGAYMRKITT